MSLIIHQNTDQSLEIIDINLVDNFNYPQNINDSHFAMTESEALQALKDFYPSSFIESINHKNRFLSEENMNYSFYHYIDESSKLATTYTFRFNLEFNETELLSLRLRDYGIQLSEYKNYSIKEATEVASDFAHVFSPVKEVMVFQDMGVKEDINGYLQLFQAEAGNRKYTVTIQLDSGLIFDYYVE